MSEKLTKLIETQGWVLADGATGTILFGMGLEAGEAPELWNDSAPDKITALYQQAVDAGSDLFLTNSFGGNASRLALHDASDRVHELNRIAAEIGRDVADKADRDVIVAGSVGPTGDIMEPVGSLSHESAVEMFEEQATGLMEGGADLLWLETISAPEEFAAAAEAFTNIGAPWTGTMSFDTAGRTMMGVTSKGMVEMVDGMDNAPSAFGANCGVGASDLLRTVKGFADAGARQPIIAKANAGIPQFVDGNIVYTGTPELMADYAVMARDCGAVIIGGCCGTCDTHLTEMRRALERHEKGEPPSLGTIADRMGAFSSASDGTDDTAAAPQRQRRRKRA